ncbi:transcriptional regulator NrdR [Candidatus Saccharibacteria bacterium]|nr:transcriptional regulator NrdR [Candidatus Saccharibacteria bacterium]MBI3337732.1 transcriptional regulator NrdR [Candidatus Saccharibacteria bacterium]
MKCSQCHQVDTKVIESRDVSDGEAIRRRRECTSCHYRFTTYERLERPQIIVIKNNGTRELFNREKLLGGLYRACEKTPVTSLQLERLVSNIEHQIYDCGDQEVRSAKIGDMVMDQLARTNEVAYVRFASVYRRFKDIAGFERELLQIRERKTSSLKV